MNHQKHSAVLENKPDSKRGGIRVRLVTDEASFRRLGDAWEELAERSGVPVFSRYEWLYCWWKHFGRHPKRKLCIVTFYEDRHLIGIAPFYIGSSSAGSVTVQRRLYLMGCGTNRNEFFGYSNDYGISDFLDVIAHPDYRERVAGTLATLLNRNPMNADLVTFQHVSEESFVIRELLHSFDERNFSYSMKKTDECPVVTVPDTLDEYIRQTGPSSRRRRLRKNLTAAGNEYSVEKATTPAEMMAYLVKLISLHQDRWNRLGFPGTFSDRRHVSFIREICQLLHHKGWLWLGYATDEDGCSAIRLAVNDGTRIYDLHTALNESSPASRHSPGLGLLVILICEAIESNIRIVELMRGTERYKYDFTRETRQNWRITLPLQSQRPRYTSIIHLILKGMAAVYYRVTREWKLLQVHYQQSGILNMAISYGSSRVRDFINKNR